MPGDQKQTSETSADAPAPAPARRKTAGRRPRRPARRLTGQAAIAVLAVLLVAELGARAIGEHLPPLLTGDGYEMEIKAEQLRGLAAGPESEQPEVIFLGNSMTDAGVSPEAFTGASERFDRAYNASLVGAPVNSQARWAERFVLDGLDPEVIVLGVSPLDLLDVNPLDLLDVTKGEGRSQAVQAAFDDTLDRLEPSAMQRLEERANDASALVRHRSSLRNPRALGRAVGDAVTGEEPREGIPQVATVEGGAVVPRDLDFWRDALRPTGGTDQFHDRALSDTRDPDLEARIAAAAVSADYRPERLRTLLEAVEAEGRQILIAAPPLALETMTPTQPGAPERLREGIALMEEIAADFDAEVVDFTGRDYPLALFADVSHLNRAGSERFSRDLALTLDARR